MIEFKADCGHTVRAKDEDAGKAVRCAYCGREVQVPQDEEDAFDFFFDGEAGSGKGSSRGQTKASSGGGRSGMPFGLRASRVDPFTVVKKMVFVAGILIVVIFVGRKYAWPLVNEHLLTGANSTRSPVPAKKVAKPAPIPPSPPPKKYGLLKPRLDRRGKEGIHIGAVPRLVKVFYRELDSASRGYEWLQDPRALRIEGPPYTRDLDPGPYEVVVMLLINDRQLKRNYRAFGYVSFRRQVEDDIRRRDQAVRAYFAPDTATDVKIIEIGDSINIARRYEIIVRRNEWQVLAPLFLPATCKMEDVIRFLPKEDVYGFDEQDILDELAHYKVAAEDRGFIVDILNRIGSISYGYPPPDGRYRMLKISADDGMFTAPFLDATRKRVKDSSREP